MTDLSDFKRLVYEPEIKRLRDALEAANSTANLRCDVPTPDGKDICDRWPDHSGHHFTHKQNGEWKQRPGDKPRRDPDYSRAYQDEYQRLWHEAAAERDQLRAALEAANKERDEAMDAVGLPRTATLEGLIRHHRANEAMAVGFEVLRVEAERDRLAARVDSACEALSETDATFIRAALASVAEPPAPTHPDKEV